MSKPLEGLYMLRDQLHQNSHIAETCRFFRWLSGKSVHAYAKAIGVSHTYWHELENGIKQNPSSKVKKVLRKLVASLIPQLNHYLKINLSILKTFTHLSFLHLILI